MRSYSEKILGKIHDAQGSRRGCDTSNLKISQFNIGDIRVFPIVLDMDTVDAIRTPIRFKQYDYGTCFIDFQLVEGDKPIVLDGVSVVGIFKNSNLDIVISSGASVKSDGVIIIPGEGVIKVEIPKGVLMYPGDIECEILLFDNNHGRSTSPRVIFSVEQSLFDHENESGFTEDLRYSFLTDLMRNVNILHSNTETLIHNTNVLHSDIAKNEIIRVSQEKYRQDSIKNMESVFVSKVVDVDGKINEVNVAIAAGTQDLEVKQSRVGQDGTEYDCLNSRLNAIENSPHTWFEDVEG